jgi:hypothetical protein
MANSLLFKLGDPGDYQRVGRSAARVGEHLWVQGRARVGALTTGEAIGRGAAVHAPAAVRSATAIASAQVGSMAERANKRNSPAEKVSNRDI